MTAKEIFQKFFNGQTNLMTPNVLGYTSIPGNYYVELSDGEWVDRSRIYGVTVLHINAQGVTEHMQELCKGFNKEATARTYIKQLRSRFRKEQKRASDLQEKVSVSEKS